MATLRPTAAPAVAATKETAEAEYFVFYSRIPNSTVIFPDGTSAGFVNGRYTTQDEEKAAILRQAIEGGNNSLYLDAEKPKLTEAELDPMAEYKARVIAEYLEKQANAASNDRGTSTQGRLNVADTSSIGEAAADSSSTK